MVLLQEEQFKLIFQLNAYRRYTKISYKEKKMDIDEKTYRSVIDVFITTGQRLHSIYLSIMLGNEQSKKIVQFNINNLLERGIK